MNKLPGKQKGASAIVTTIVLAILAYGIYIGIQYVPQAIESSSINSIFSSIEKDHRMDHISGETEAKAKLIKLLQINEMNEMVQNVSVRQIGGKITLKIVYERELNLGYKTKPMAYEKILVLQ
jgi:hypothetical protein